MGVMKGSAKTHIKEAVALLVTLSLVWGLLPANVMALAAGDDEDASAVAEEVVASEDEGTAEDAVTEEPAVSTEMPEEAAAREEEAEPEGADAVDEATVPAEDAADAAVAVVAPSEKAPAKKPAAELAAQADSPIAVKEVAIRVTAPTAGDTSASAPGVSALGEGYAVETANWCDADGKALDSTVTFASGETYYMKVVVENAGGYAFPQGSEGTTFSVSGGELVSSSVINMMDSDSVVHSTAELVVSVTTSSASSFFGVLISDAKGNVNTGGSYLMYYPGLEGDASRTSASNNFVEDGNSVYLQAYPTNGYKFVGWYQGDPDMAQGKLYVGDPLSTDKTYEFTAPINLTRPYICAVFDVDNSPQGDQVQMWVGNTEVIGPDSSVQGGKVAVKYTPSYDVYSEIIKAKDGTNFVAGEILRFYKGDECTVYQRADEGFHFVGWYHVNIEWGPGETLAWEGDAISTAESFTYKPGQTVVAGDTEALRYVCAVFEKDEAKTCTVSFDPGTGTGSMDSVTVDAGGEYELPRCGFTHANAQRSFYRWSVDGELKYPGDAIAVSGDTVVTAKWIDNGRAKTIDKSVDKSTSEVVGTLRLTDTRTGEVTEVVAFDEGTASAFTEPSNPTVGAMIGEAKESAAAKAEEIAGGHEVKIVSEVVSDPRIMKTTDDRDRTGYVDTDDAGDYGNYLLVEGSYAHQWRYDVTVEAEYESSVAATLHWSSIDGVDLMEPVVVKTEPGTTLYDALEAAGLPSFDLFVKDGYEDYGYRSLHPVDSYADEDAFYSDCISLSDTIEDDVDIYVVMFKMLDAAEITVAAPTCGSTAAPAVSVSTSECTLDVAPTWIKDPKTHEPYKGKLVGGNEYLAEVRLAADFRCFFADDAQITVNGGELEGTDSYDRYCGIVARVAVEHSPADPVSENVVEPACTKAGSHEEVVYCSACGEEISRTTVSDAALGHDWGEWTVVTEATEEAEGLQRRTCARCCEVEEQVIPKVTVAYQLASGAGQTHVLGDGSDLTFTFKRNVRDEVAFDHFDGVRVDGKLLSAKAYVAKAGSVVVTLNASYLDTLATGEHTLTAQFDDADAVDVTFTVATEEEPTPEPKKDETKPAASTRKGLPQTGDAFVLAGLTSLTVALVGLMLTLVGRRIRER